MTRYTPHTLESAPEASKPLLESVQKAYGFVPNLAAVMAEAPALLEGYLGVNAAFSRSSLSPAEQQVVAIAASAENGCDYCVAAHSTIATRAGVTQSTIDGLRAQEPLADARLEALRAFTLSVVVDRGRPDRQALEAFLAAGYTKSQVLEVVLGVGMKTLTNYTNHITETPLDEAFAANRWEPAAAKA